MEHHVVLGGVRTRHGEQGAGDPLVLLHPGLVDAYAFGPNLAVWSARFHTFVEHEPVATLAPIRRRR